MDIPVRRLSGRVPPALLVAAGLGIAQGATFCGYALLEIVRTDQSRLTMGITTSVFFLLYGLVLALAAWRLTRLDSWARSPVLLAQLIHLGLAWSFWGPHTRVVSLVLAAVSLAVVVGLFHPASLRVLGERGEDAETGS